MDYHGSISGPDVSSHEDGRGNWRRQSLASKVLLYLVQNNWTHGQYSRSHEIYAVNKGCAFPQTPTYPYSDQVKLTLVAIGWLMKAEKETEHGSRSFKHIVGRGQL